MGQIGKECIEMFAVEGGKVDKAPNRMWIVANMVEDQLAHGSRESILELAKDMAPAIYNLIKATGDEGRKALRDADVADLSNPLVAAYFLGKFVMAQTMLHDVGSSTISTPDLEYLKTPDAMKVLQTIKELGGGTDEEIAEKAEFDLAKTKEILEITHRITATSTVRHGTKLHTRLGPVGEQVASMGPDK